VALLAAPVLFGCEAPAAPYLVDGAQRFDPPPAYQLWWEMTQECSGRQGLLGNVQWYFVPGARTLTVDGRTVEGYWTSGNAIVLAGAVILKGPLVRHEMLHALQDAGGHPREFFLGRCGGVVACDAQCAAEAGPLPPADPAMARVGPEALEISVTVTPDPPSEARYGGYFVMTVTARNPHDHPLVITLPPPTDAGPSVSFEYRIEHPGGYTESNERAWDDGVTRFAPGETKRHVFDFHAVGADESTLGGGLRPGTYDLRGAYGARWAPAVTVTLPGP
jgi:hypothetical protein